MFLLIEMAINLGWNDPEIHHWFFTPSCDGFLSTRILGQRFIILPMTDPAGAGILMLTWLGYIDGIHGTPYIAAPGSYGLCGFIMFYCLFLHCIPKKYHRTFPISGWFYSPELDTQISQTYQIATNWRYNQNTYWHYIHIPVDSHLISPYHACFIVLLCEKHTLWINYSYIIHLKSST